VGITSGIVQILQPQTMEVTTPVFSYETLLGPASFDLHMVYWLEGMLPLNVFPFPPYACCMSAMCGQCDYRADGTLYCTHEASCSGCADSSCNFNCLVPIFVNKTVTAKITPFRVSQSCAVGWHIQTRATPTTTTEPPATQPPTNSTTGVASSGTTTPAPGGTLITVDAPGLGTVTANATVIVTGGNALDRGAISGIVIGCVGTYHSCVRRHTAQSCARSVCGTPRDSGGHHLFRSAA
jgi:hypothetical protein